MILVIRCPNSNVGIKLLRNYATMIFQAFFLWLILVSSRKAQMVTKGAAAVKTLRQGATRLIPPQSRYRNIFEKPGSLSTALQEFRSLNPTDVKRIELDTFLSSTRVLRGRVGDRLIILKNADVFANGRPTITVFDPTKASKLGDMIIYQRTRADEELFFLLDNF